MSKARIRKKRRLEERAVDSRQRQTRIWIGAGVIGALLLAGVVAWSVYRSNQQPASGQAMPIQGQQHIPVGQSHPAYNSDPPTSGWHYAEPARAGYYDTPLPDEQLVHNLEHGHVIISYDCGKLADCDSVKAELQDIVGRFQRWKIVAVARENTDAAIALTAWGRIDKLDSYDEDRIVAFVKKWRNRGPENTPE